jgi:hypothetical protein
MVFQTILSLASIFNTDRLYEPRFVFEPHNNNTLLASNASNFISTFVLVEPVISATYVAGPEVGGLVPLKFIIWTYNLIGFD